jgi:hypothetical protein
MTYLTFQFTPDPMELGCISLSGKFCSGFVKCKMNFYLCQTASATSVKELDVLKQHCNPVNFSRSSDSKKNMGPVLDNS